LGEINMSLDGRILARAMDRLTDRNNKREARTARLREEVYKRLPRVADIDKELTLSMIEAASAALEGGSDPEEAVRKVAEKNLSLQAERAELMVAAGFPMDCLDDKPLCNTCRDRGYVGSKPCQCLMELYREEQRKELSQLLKLGEENFEAFNLDYYSSVPDPGTGISPRENMELVYETCRLYAGKFGTGSGSLFFTGAPGLGKTFLSACIAREVAEKGYSVVYDTAQSVFSSFEDEKFSKNYELEETRSDIARYMNCDLLILDDLGTEMTTAFTISALYDLVNTRLAAGKQTIINSNLDIDEIRKRYSPAIASRLEGEYQKLSFYGRDIRLIKKEIY
jgi:DNA replication protein DnaC